MLRGNSRTGGPAAQRTNVRELSWKHWPRRQCLFAIFVGNKGQTNKETRKGAPLGWERDRELGSPAWSADTISRRARRCCARGCQRVHKRQREKDQHAELPLPGRGWSPTASHSGRRSSSKHKPHAGRRRGLCSPHTLLRAWRRPSPAAWSGAGSGSLLAPGARGSWMACSRCRFAAGGGRTWHTWTVQMGIKFSLMFIICQRRRILCQSGLEGLLLRSFQKFLCDKTEDAALRL